MTPSVSLVRRAARAPTGPWMYLYMKYTNYRTVIHRMLVHVNYMYSLTGRGKAEEYRDQWHLDGYLDVRDDVRGDTTPSHLPK